MVLMWHWSKYVLFYLVTKSNIYVWKNIAGIQIHQLFTSSFWVIWSWVNLCTFFGIWHRAYSAKVRCKSRCLQKNSWNRMLCKNVNEIEIEQQIICVHKRCWNWHQVPFLKVTFHFIKRSLRIHIKNLKESLIH